MIWGSSGQQKPPVWGRLPRGQTQREPGETSTSQSDTEEDKHTEMTREVRGGSGRMRNVMKAKGRERFKRDKDTNNKC